MQSIQQPVVEHDVISSGVDWITATNQGGSLAMMSDEFASNEFNRVLDKGRRVVPASRLGYVGHESEHFFYGGRGHGRIMIASGVAAANLYRSINQLSDNITRLDVQVTIFCHGEQPHLGRQAYQCLQSKSPSRVAVRNVQLIESHPQGETCNVGKRSSDSYGRVYDKATEAGLGEARTVWRYEVEVKRRVAASWAAALCSDHSDQARARALVWHWFTDRGLQPPFSEPRDSSTLELTLGRRDHDTLQWFRDSLSKTVARMITLHGRETVLDALGLDINDLSS